MRDWCIAFAWGCVGGLMVWFVQSLSERPLPDDPNRNITISIQCRDCHQFMLKNLQVPE